MVNNQFRRFIEDDPSVERVVRKTEPNVNNGKSCGIPKAFGTGIEIYNGTEEFSSGELYDVFGQLGQIIACGIMEHGPEAEMM